MEGAKLKMAKVTVTNELLAAALAGYEAELERIDVKMGEIRRMLGDIVNNKIIKSVAARPKRKFSAASRRKMAASQRARYAKLKQAAEPPQAESAKPKKKRKMSAAGKAAIIAGVKKRWAAVRAAKQAQKPAVAKKPGRKKAVARKSMTAEAREQSAAVAAGQ